MIHKTIVSEGEPKCSSNGEKANIEVEFYKLEVSNKDKHFDDYK